MGRSEWEEKWVGTGRNKRSGNYDQYILYDLKIIFSKGKFNAYLPLLTLMYFPPSYFSVSYILESEI